MVESFGGLLHAKPIEPLARLSWWAQSLVPGLLSTATEPLCAGDMRALSAARVAKQVAKWIDCVEGWLRLREARAAAGLPHDDPLQVSEYGLAVNTPCCRCPTASRRI